MKRLLRYCPTGYPVHVIQRGNNRDDCYVSNLDRATYVKYLRAASKKYLVDIHAWVLMTNHVHLLLTPSSDDGVSNMMQHLGRQYVRYFNRKHKRSGTLWEGRFRSCLVQSERYLLACQRYIELNPVRAGIVESPSEYHWSSYGTNALGKKSSICTPHSVYVGLGLDLNSRLEAYRELFQEVLTSEQIETIRHSINRGMPLGSESFQSKLEQELPFSTN